MRIPGLWIHGITVFSALAGYYEGRKIYGLFNFSEYDKTAWINERDGIYKDLITGQEMEAAGVNVPAYGFFWLKKIN